MTAFFARIRGNLRALLTIPGVLALVGVWSLAPPSQAATAACSALSANVYERVHPTAHSASLTLSRTQSTSFARRGFVAVRETSMRMATRGGRGLVAVHRLYRTRYGPDFFYTTSRSEITRATTRRGYVDEGVAFYAATAPAACLVPVWSYRRNGLHRFLSTSADQAALLAAGWTKEKVRFYAGRATPDTRFSFAVYPDTQEEVYSNHNGRFRQRSQWLADHRPQLDLRFMVHTGDIVNWDTPDHGQYRTARDALVPLDKAGIPYSLSPGNHDTAAVCPGGSACDPARTYDLLRDTTTYNRYFSRQSVNREGAYERGKRDNTYQIYTAGGVGWLVLNLEMWPRDGVVKWAQRVVAGHPKHNVIVVTHHYLTKTGAISSQRDYGDTAPTVLARELILKYPNVRMVFSGHTGTAAYRIDRGMHGNRVAAFLTTMHDGATNPVRLVQVDTRTNTLKTWMYAPWTSTSYPQFTVQLSGRNWLR
jgi:3',5'-cyclic AMP phosphodiesterase CpdA